MSLQDRPDVLATLNTLFEESPTVYGRLVRLLVLQLIHKRARRSQRERATIADIQRVSKYWGRRPSCSDEEQQAVLHLSCRQAAKRLGIHHAGVWRWRRQQRA